MEKEELMDYVKSELHHINRSFKSHPMPQVFVGTRNELEFILDLLEGNERAIMIARSVIESEKADIAKEELNNGK